MDSSVSHEGYWPISCFPSLVHGPGQFLRLLYRKDAPIKLLDALPNTTNAPFFQTLLWHLRAKMNLCMTEKHHQRLASDTKVTSLHYYLTQKMVIKGGPPLIMRVLL